MEYLIVTAADKGGPYEDCIKEQRKIQGENFLGMIVPSRGSWAENTKIKPDAIRAGFQFCNVVLWVDADCYVDPPESLPPGDWDICTTKNIHPLHKIKISAGFILLRNTKRTVKFLKLWDLLNSKAKKDHPALIKALKMMRNEAQIDDMTEWIKGRHTINKFNPSRGMHAG